MKKTLLLSVLSLAAVVACEKTPAPELQDTVKIEPIITRATMVNFEQGDMIGLNITKADATVHAENACLTYDAEAQVFTGDLKWYAEGGEASTLMAFYPYNQAGFPSTFTVATDQSASAGASDFMVAYKENVKPQAQGVTMQFKHYLSQILILVDNQAGATIDNITIKDLIPTAAIAKEGSEITVSADETAEAADIIAEPIEAGLKYRAIIVPQTAPFGVVVQVKDGSTLVTGVTEVTLKPSYQYTINVTVLADEVKVAVAGEILAWEDGGVLGGSEDGYVVPFEEHLDENYFLYAGKRYSTVLMDDGKIWMAQNLAYVPLGYTPSSDLNNVKAGVYYPIKVNAGNTAVEFTTDEDIIAANGYLYQVEVALGLKVGDIKTIADAEALEGAQGICPRGWHIPTVDDIRNLVGKGVGFTTLETAPYYDSVAGNGKLSLLNADGFNADAFGAVNLSDNTKTAATLMGWLSGNPTAVSSGYFCGSTYGGVNYAKDENNQPTDVITNIKFRGMLIMANNDTCNGSDLGYRMGTSVRCVRDAE
ncbi:MAG: fimbrillin family protein [Bacteroidales bacterium]|nr:fimbrillin family protein [Bacteroidales bacterium]